MSRFNLIDEKWIPVRFPDGSRDELGIRDTLLRSREIESIEDQSPLVVAALYRFLLAVLYRALEGPTDIDQAREYFRDGFPENKITNYLDKWRDRFWLFDDKYPFYQVADYEPKQWKSWTKIAAEHNADNAKVLFDHIDIRDPEPISLPRFVCWLLSVHTFDLAVAKSEFLQPLDAPSARPILFIVTGKTLHDTLCLCLRWQAAHILKNDLAQWEKTPETTETMKDRKSKRIITGYADLFSWQSRSLIVRDPGTNFIQHVGFASGLAADQEKTVVDPMICYYKDDESGLIPIKFREDRDFWRDFDSLFLGGSTEPPLVIQNAIDLCRFTAGKWPVGVLICGQKTRSGQAKVDFWRMERFVLPEALATNKFIGEEIRQFLDIAEETQKSLWQACSAFARDILSHGSREPDKKDISKVVKQMTASSLYWSSLESRFHEILRSYVHEDDLDDVRCQWLIYVQEALRNSWNQHCATVASKDAWTLRALTKSEGPVRRKLKELRDEIQNYRLQEVES
tara:strand:- start:37491 stop:39026 length:1536 start_codon:yes stop_codon:yes gene_type:complete